MILLSVLIYSHPLYSLDYLFKSYSTLNGLLDNSVQQVVSLEDGRILVTTKGQLNFFDGLRFRYIKSNDNNPYELKDYNGHYHLYIDRHGHYWLKNRHKVSCISQYTEDYLNAKEEILNFSVDGQVTDLFCTSDNCIWFVENSSVLYGHEANIRIDIPKGHGELQDLDVYEGREILLFFSDGSISVIKLNNLKEESSSMPYDSTRSKEYSKSSVFYKYGTHYYQLRNGDKSSVLLDYDVANRAWSEVKSFPYHLNNITSDEDSVLYIASEYGLILYNLSTKEISEYPTLSLIGGGTIGTDINAIAFDYQGGLWLGTEKRGLLYSRPFAIPFKSYSWETKDSDRLWPLLKDVQLSSTYKGRYCNCLYKDGKYEWVGTDYGLILCKDGVEQAQFNIDNGLANNVVHSVIKDDNGIMWLATSRGISSLRYNMETGESVIHNYDENDGILSNLFVDGVIVKTEENKIVIQGMDYITEFSPTDVKEMLGTSTDRRNSLKPIFVSLFVDGERINPGQVYGKRVIMENAPSQCERISVSYDKDNIIIGVSALNYFRPHDTDYRYRLLGGSDSTWHVVNDKELRSDDSFDYNIHIVLNKLEVGTFKLEVQASTSSDFTDAETRTLLIDVYQPWWRSRGLVILGILLLVINFLLLLYAMQRNYGLRVTRKNNDNLIFSYLVNVRNGCKNLLNTTVYIDKQHEENSSMDNDKKIMRFFVNLRNYEMAKEDTESYDINDFMKSSSYTRSDIYNISAIAQKMPRRRLQTLYVFYMAAKTLQSVDISIEDLASDYHFRDTQALRDCFDYFLDCSPEEYKRGEMDIDTIVLNE